MVIPTMRIPTLSHNQDPWPYRPQAYIHWREHVTAFLKRREQKRALKLADCMGFWDRETHMSKSEWKAACVRTMQDYPTVLR